MRVLFMPSVEGNPYLDLLAGGLAEHGVDVRMSRDARRPLPLVQAGLGRRRADVLHLHWTQPYLYWPRTSRPSRVLAWRLLAQLRLLKRRGVRIVWTLHNMAAHESDDPEPELEVSREIARLADRLIVHCQAARQTALAQLGEVSDVDHKLVVVPHGHYIGAYADVLSRADARAGLGFEPQHRVFLFFGRLRRYKGAQELLEAFRALPQPEARLVLAGRCRSEEVRREVQQLVARDTRVLADLHFVPDDEVQRYLRAADVAVLPFRDVLTSGSVVLAMSFGLPVVAPRLGCLPENLAGQPQLLYDASGPDALERALGSALGADLPALGAANRTAIESYDWKGVAERTIRLAYS